MRSILNALGIYKYYQHYLLKEINKGEIPKHIAVILDGNRRWAKKNTYMQKIGHERGADRVEELIDWCRELGIKIITIYGLSTENLEKRHEEIDYLFELMENRLNKLLNEEKLHKYRMRVTGIGKLELLPQSLQNVIQKLEEVSKNYDNIYFNIAIAYGGQDELVEAIKKITRLVKDGKLDIEKIDKNLINSYLYTSYLPQPEPDLILRTSGEQRLSGFLLWQSAYSELVFMDVYWPEFRKIDLMRAIRIYQHRQRRYGV
ncbi:MAG: polyprenyl diphosphate synthase [Candidatus Nitrosocaldaceae archaeon]